MPAQAAKKPPWISNAELERRACLRSKGRFQAIEKLWDPDSLVRVVRFGQDDIVAIALRKLQNNYPALEGIAQTHQKQWVRKEAQRLAIWNYYGL